MRFLFSLLAASTLLVANQPAVVGQGSIGSKLGWAHIAGFEDVAVAALELSLESDEYPVGFALELGSTLSESKNSAIWRPADTSRSLRHRSAALYMTHQVPLVFEPRLSIRNRIGLVYKQAQMRIEESGQKRTVHFDDLSPSVSMGLEWQLKSGHYMGMELVWLDPEIAHWLIGYRVMLLVP